MTSIRTFFEIISFFVIIKYFTMNLDLSVSTIMSSDPNSVAPDQKLVDVKHIYEQRDFHSHIPVVKDTKVVGIVSLINFMRAIHDATLDDNELVYQNMFVKDIMTRNPVSISSNATIRDAVKILSEGQFHSILVIDNDELKGIVSTTDIARELLND